MSYNGSGVFTINTTGQPVVTGTTISSTVFNTLTADLATGLTTALTKDGQSTPTANIKLGAFKITNLGAATLASDAARLDQIQGGGAFTFVTAAGTDTITGTTSPTLTAYATGNQFSFLVANTNTGAVTINVDALGAKAITRTGTTALVAGDMVAGQIVEIIYDGTRFQLVNGNSFTNLKTSGTLGVTGAATLSSTLGVTGAATLSSTLGVTGASTLSSTLGVTGASTFTVINTARATVASAATTADIWAAAGNQIDWTGTTTCTGFPAAPQAGAERVLITAGAAVFTAGANMLIDGVTSASDLTCAANDAVIVRAVTTTQFKLSRVKYDGTAQVSAGGITTTASITANTTLTVASAGYQYIAMTALGKSVTLPDATTVSIGSPKFYLDNTSGGYPVGIRNYSGTLLMAIAAGGTAFVSCQNISSAAGVWAITGTNLEPGLITIDNTFSSTYLTTSTSLNKYVALDDNKSIHFLAIASGFAAVAVDNTTGAVGTPVTVSATAGAIPCIAFMITSTTAIVFFTGGTSGTLISRIISLSGATTLAMGTASSTLTAAGVAVENSSGAPKIVQLDTTLYLVSYATATGAGTTSVAAFQVSGGTTVTLGSAVNIIAASNCINSTVTIMLTTLTASVVYKSGAGVPYATNAVIVSVTNANPPVCTVGTPVAITNVTAATFNAPSVCKLSATKLLVGDDGNTTSVVVNAVTISGGTTVTAGTSVTVATGLSGNGFLLYTTDFATRLNPHLYPITSTTAFIWFNSADISRTAVLTEASGVVTSGTLTYKTISSAASNAEGNGAIIGISESNGVVVKANSSETNGYNLFISTLKISGTSVTAGTRCTRPLNPATYTYLFLAAKLSATKYAIYPSDAGAIVSGIEVIKTNGDYTNELGAIAAPSLSQTNIPAVVGTNRFVLIGETKFLGTSVGVTTYQVRLLNIEVAA